MSDGTTGGNEGKKIGRRVFKGFAYGCLLPLAFLILIAWGGLFYARQPRLNSAHATRVDLNLHLDVEPYTNHLGAITNSIEVRRFMSVLAGSHAKLDHKCQSVGWFQIDYDNGTTRRIHFLPGHDINRYEWRNGLFNISMNRAEFFDVLHACGIGTNQFPELDR